ncbi:MAG TPA: hypothetical protein VG734_17815 [Lacunisphaera sp.]|nr:hypothetical protein [Lacunisphaera sp.]
MKPHGYLPRIIALALLGAIFVFLSTGGASRRHQAAREHLPRPRGTGRTAEDLRSLAAPVTHGTVLQIEPGPGARFAAAILIERRRDERDPFGPA